MGTAESGTGALMRAPEADTPMLGRTESLRDRPGLLCDTIRAADLPAIHREVAALARRSLEANVFLEPSFLHAALIGLGAAGRVRLLTVREAGGPLLGLLPVTVRSMPAGLPVATASAWRHPYGTLWTPLLDRERPEAALEALLSGLRHLPERPRLLLLPDLPASGALAETFREVARRSGSVMRVLGSSQRAVLATGLDGPSYLARAISAKKRKELRRQRRRLEELGPLSFALNHGPAEIRDGFHEFVALEAAGWKGRRGSALAFRPAERTFVERAVLDLAAERKALVARLTLAGRPIAAGIVLLSGERAFYWKTAYDERLSRFSPGVLMTLDLTQALISQGRGGDVDSCALVNHPMIDHVWRERREFHDMLIPLDPDLPDLWLAAVARAEMLRRKLRRGLRRVIVSARERWFG